MEVIGSKGSTTLGTLSETGVITTADALGAEDMETLGEDSVLLPRATAGTVELGLREGKCESDSRRWRPLSAHLVRTYLLKQNLI